jgi:hypothetical protein
MIVDEDRARQDVHAWGRTARVSGLIAGVGLFLQTVLFLVDAAGILRGFPSFHESGNGLDKDLATYYVAVFERQHDVAWDLALRNTVSAVASVALIVLALAFARVHGRGRPRAEVWALVFAVGALLRLVADLAYLSQLGVWRFTGFGPIPPADIIAAGRTAEAVGDLADYLEDAAFLTLAVALVGLAALLSSRLGLLARVLAAALVVAVVAALAFWDVAFEVTALLVGALLGPVFLVGLGRWLARPSTAERAHDGVI